MNKGLSKDYSFYKNIYILLKSFHSKIWIIAVSIFMTSLINIFNPLLRQYLIDYGIMKQNISIVVIVVIVTMVIFLINTGIDFIQFIYSTKIQQILPFQLYYNGIAKLFHLKLSYFRDVNFTQAIGNLSYDVSTISQVADRGVIVAIVQLLNVIGGVIGLTIINWRLTLLVLLTVPIRILVNNYFAKKRTSLFQRIMKVSEAFNGWYGDALSNIEVIKLWNHYGRIRSVFASHQRKVIVEQLKLAYSERYNEITTKIIDTAFSLLIYLFGAILIFNGSMSLGGLFAFQSYASYVIVPISLLTHLKYQMAGIKPSLERYIDFINQETEEEYRITQKESIVKFETISFEHVSLFYDSNKVLNDINIKIGKGQKVAIVGNNGSGKTSLINLLLRFYIPSEGRITVNGKDIKDYRLADYRDIFSIIGQKVNLFNSTVRENVDLHHKYSDIVIKDCFKKWGCESLLNTLPQGLDTVVGSEGNKLSGGERQKLTLIRALLKGAKILILDEATSNYDVESEQLFNKTLESCNCFDCVIVVTHREDILQQMDRVIRLENGNVVDIQNSK